MDRRSGHGAVYHRFTTLFLLVSAASIAQAVDFSPPPIDVPEGFEVQLAAAPPLVKYPMMACLDHRGRLFIAESQGQNLEKEELLEQRARFIRMLEDTDGDGQFDKSTIFADQLVMPEGALWFRDSLFVLSSPYLWRFRDTDDDGVADQRERLVGSMEFNGKANQHGAYLDPNGRLYFSGGTFGYELKGTDSGPTIRGNSAGVFSCWPDGTHVEVFGNGGINPVEVAFTPEGELLSTCAIFDRIDGRHDALIHWVRGGLAGPEDFRPPVVKRSGYRLPALSRWGQVAPSGLMRYRSIAWGPRFQNTYFTAQFNTGAVVNTRLERMGATFRSFDETFLTSSSEDFHPTDVLEDADGSLLVVDTGGWFRISCPESQVAKPEILGAIYRIRKKNAPVADDPRGERLDWQQATSAQLVERLGDDRPVVRDRAIETLSRRGDAALSDLAAALASNSVLRRRNSVWTTSQIDAEAARALLRRSLADPDSSVRQAAVRSVGVRRDPESVPLLLEILKTDKPSLRRASATALGQIGRADAVPHLLNAAAEGGDDFLMHSLVYALIEIGEFDLTLRGLESGSPLAQHAALVALDQMAPHLLTADHVVRLLDSGDVVLRQTALEIVTSRDGWGDQIVEFLGRWLSGKLPTAADAEISKGAIGVYVENKKVQQLVARALRSESTPPEIRAGVLEAMGRLSDLPDAWTGPLDQLLRAGDDAVRRQVISAIKSSGTRKVDPRLRDLAQNPTTDEGVRVAAWNCLAAGGESLPDDAFFLLLRRTSLESHPPFERLDAARGLAAASLELSQLRSLADALPQMGPLELPVVIEAFARGGPLSHELADHLAPNLGQSPGLAGILPARLEAILAMFPSTVQPAAETLLARVSSNKESRAARLEQMGQQLGEGKAEHGKSIFFSHRAACSACHRVHGEGGTIGPDLSSIAKIRQRQDLLEAILFPSASLANGYETFTILTADGRTVQGVIHRATSNSIVLRNTQRQEVVISRSDIDQLVPSPTSIMPQGLEESIPIQELSDLLAFLTSLRGQEP